MGHVNWLTVGEPHDAGRNSVVHAQFNAAYGFARALADGKVDLRTYQRPNITDAGIASLAARTSVVSDPTIESTAIAPVRVRIQLKDGRSIERAADTIKGSPQEPIADGDLLAKFYACLEFGLNARRCDAERLAAVVHALESSADAARDIVEAFRSEE